MDQTQIILFNVSVVIQIILFIALIISVFALTKLVKSLKNKVDVLEENFNNYKKKVDPLIENTQNLVTKINGITDKVNENIKYLTLTVDKVKIAVEEVITFKNKVMTKAEPPILETINAFTAVVKGVKMFSDTWKNNKPVRREKVYEEDNLLLDSNNDVDFELEKQYDDINKELNDVRKKLEEMKKV